jgi:anti-sigma regulatory factor (Ser/Thr protein kinase)
MQTIALPRTFNTASMYGLISQVIESSTGIPKWPQVNFDFTALVFIEPVGVVVLSNLIEYLGRKGSKSSFSGLALSKPVIYLDDSGFFLRYLGKPIREHAAVRIGTLPLTLVANPEAIGFLYMKMIPWLALRMGMNELSLSVVRVCIEEIFHNISDHSGVNVGCVHAQYFPVGKDIQIAISDFGTGIPYNVRKVQPSVDDASALTLACQEGFTTQSNVRNRGAGLATLIKYVTGRNRGNIWIVSGQANLSAIHDHGISKMTARSTTGTYPGTLVRVTLKEDSIVNLAKDIEHEEFSW